MAKHACLDIIGTLKNPTGLAWLQKFCGIALLGELLK
jgi:hypothetical protein